MIVFFAVRGYNPRSRVRTGVAHKAEVVAWAVAPVQEGGEGPGRRVRSSPLLALPVALAAPRRFPVADGATIQFQMGTSTCRPGASVARAHVGTLMRTQRPALFRAGCSSGVSMIAHTRA